MSSSSSLLLLLSVQVLLILVIHFTINQPSSQALVQFDNGGQHSNSTDRLALLSFKSLVTTTTTQDALASWNDSSGICNWFGVRCDARRHPGRVTSLNLDSVNLAGTLSPSLSNLTLLQELHLAGNNFHGVIPQEFGQLGELQLLNLTSNSIEGDIPKTLGNLGNLQTLTLDGNKLQGNIPANLSQAIKLQYLVLKNNELTGEIPPELGSLRNLQLLSLRNNKLTGKIPTSIGNMSDLIYLYLSNNNLDGTIPSELKSMTNLVVLDLMFNRLSGNIPLTLFNFSDLYTFGVGGNQLTGRFPPDFGQHLPSLGNLYLYDNYFTGNIPSSLTNASTIQLFELSNNSFTGRVPPIFRRMENLSKVLIGNNKLVAEEQDDWEFVKSLKNCSVLDELDLSNNNFSGSLSNSILSNLPPSLTWLRLRGNQIKGEIPSGIGDLVSLVTVNLENNRFSGSIPTSTGKLRNLTAFSVTSNNLSGVIPDSICNLTQMLELYLGENKFNGSIPSCFSSMKNLIVMDLSHNNLSGTVPKGLLSISSVGSFLNLSNNLLSGSLPEEVGSLVNLQVLDVSDNRFHGGIPQSLGKCLVLESLYLQGNDFNGTIPDYLDNLKAIQILDMSRNNLSGPIPIFLEEMAALQFLNLSFNDLEGEVPTGGIFGNSSRFSVEGNLKLCSGDSKLKLRPCTRSGHKKLSKPVLSAVISISVIGFLLIIFFLVYKFSPRKQVRVKSERSNDQLLQISYTDIRRVTGDFSPENLIGTGGFGSVYRGTINGQDGNSREIAVKVLNEKIRSTSKSFVAECNVLRNIRHRNIVGVLTVCSSEDPKGNEFKALVYEFMPNGSLEKWLQRGNKTLNLMQRLNIAIDVALALDYLHTQTEITVVHRDLKPSNVLLDSDMVARVSDFGISKFLSPDHDQTTTTGIQGSIGYIAPGIQMI